MIYSAQVTKTKKNNQLQQQEQYQILCLDYPSDDDLSKFYYLESQNKGKWYRLVATAFGTVSCSCVNQTRNPYKSCKHMKIIDEIIYKSPYKIQSISKIPQLILNL